MRTILFFCAVLIVLGTDTYAKGIGLEAGFSMNSLSANIDNTKTYNLLKPGLRTGLTLDNHINDHLFLQYGVFYNPKGGYISFDRTYTEDGLSVKQDFDGYLRIDYLELPISLLYRSNYRNDGHFFAGGGVYLSAALGGVISYERFNTYSNHKQNTLFVFLPLAIGNDANNNDVKTFDAGLQAQIGYELRSGFFTRLHASYGLVNISPSPDRKFHNQNFGLSVGYMLR